MLQPVRRSATAPASLIINSGSFVMGCFSSVQFASVPSAQALGLRQQARKLVQRVREIGRMLVLGPAIQLARAFAQAPDLGLQLLPGHCVARSGFRLSQPLSTQKVISRSRSNCALAALIA